MCLSMCSLVVYTVPFNHLVSQDMVTVENKVCVLHLRKKNVLQTFSYCSASKVHGANMGPIWVMSAPNRAHDCPTSLAIRVYLQSCQPCQCQLVRTWLRINASLNYVIIGSGNGLSPVRRQTVTWTITDVSWTIGNAFQYNLNQNTKLAIQRCPGAK